MRIWEQFPVVAARVREQHERVGLVSHHDCVHAYRVADVAHHVASIEWGDERTAHLAGLAGLCHNADRLIQVTMRFGHKPAPRQKISDFTEELLKGSVDKVAIMQVTEAVLMHDQKNSADDPHVLIALKDADRVVNLDMDVIMRAAQHHSELRTVDYLHFVSDPSATYHDPKSVLRDIAFCLDWVDNKSDVCVRTTRGMAMAMKRAAPLKAFFQTLEEQLTEEGAYPFPL